jgi:hypothetical protein
MEVSEQESARYIEELAQAVPFKFVDRIIFLNDSCVVTELHSRGLPHRFADATEVDTFGVLEFAAQSSGLILRERKKPGQRGVISSFQNVERKQNSALQFPLRLESQLIDERWSFFEFRFKVLSGAELAVEGNINIFIGG